MKSLLTDDEKKYLRAVSNYIQSLGMPSGIVDFEIEYDSIFNPKDVRWDQITHFSNHYRAEIPSKLNPILKKIVDAHADKFNEPLSEDNINWESVTVEIDAKEKVLMITHNWSYYAEGDTLSTEWDYTEDEEVGKLFEELEEAIPVEDRYDKKYLNLKYDGSGDSGFIEDRFDEGNGNEVPAAVSDWCYDRLESLHGGWEINEGSRGTFEFDFDDKKIILYHTDNVNMDESTTIYEESFAK